MVDWSPIIVDVRRAIQKSSLEVRNGFAVPKTIPEDAVIRVRQITLRIIREITVRFQKLDRLPILSKKNSQAGSQCHLSFNRSIALETVDKFVLRGVGADQPVMQRRCRKNGDWGDVPGVRFVPQSRNESNRQVQGSSPCGGAFSTVAFSNVSRLHS